MTDCTIITLSLKFQVARYYVISRMGNGIIIRFWETAYLPLP